MLMRTPFLKTVLFTILAASATGDGARAEDDWRSFLDLGVAPVVGNARGEWRPLRDAPGVTVSLKTIAVASGQSIDTLLAGEGVRADGDSRGLILLLNPNLADVDSLAAGEEVAFIDVAIAADSQPPLTPGTTIAITANLADRIEVGKLADELKALADDPRARQISPTLLPAQTSPNRVRFLARDSARALDHRMRNSVVLDPSWTAGATVALAGYKRDFEAVMHGQRPTSVSFGQGAPLKTLSHQTPDFGSGLIKVEATPGASAGGASAGGASSGATVVGGASASSVVCGVFWVLAGIDTTANSRSVAAAGRLTSTPFAVRLQSIDVWAQYDGAAVSDKVRVLKQQLRLNRPQPVLLTTSQRCAE